ncbi:MAG: ABC transporter permease [Sphaerochaetaceae bacterium]
MNSITPARKQKIIKIGAIFFWLAVWQIVATWLSQDILLVPPSSVLLRLVELIQSGSFWQSIGYSFQRITGGFALATFAGVVLAIFSYVSRPIEQLLAPLMQTIMATPVASFVILALVWVSSKNLSAFITFLMVLPILYTNVLTGIRSTDHKLLEMTVVFRVPVVRRIRFVYMPEVLPFFRSACSVALGLGWKSGIAAEVISIPVGSIGEKLYQAKIFLDTPDMFSWTLVIILLSVGFEKICMLLIELLMRKMR